MKKNSYLTTDGVRYLTVKPPFPEFVALRPKSWCNKLFAFFYKWKLVIVVIIPFRANEATNSNFVYTINILKIVVF